MRVPLAKKPNAAGSEDRFPRGDLTEIAGALRINVAENANKQDATAKKIDSLGMGDDREK